MIKPAAVFDIEKLFDNIRQLYVHTPMPRRAPPSR
jgi:hypothetical protein